MVIIQRGIALVALCLIGAAQAATPSPVEPRRREVLPDSVVPRHYDLALAPDAESLTFTGKVAITVEVIAPGPTITLNAAGLTFDHAAIDGGPDARVRLDNGLGRATLTFATRSPPDNTSSTSSITGQ